MVWRQGSVWCWCWCWGIIINNEPKWILMFHQPAYPELGHVQQQCIKISIAAALSFVFKGGFQPSKRIQFLKSPSSQQFQDHDISKWCHHVPTLTNSCMKQALQVYTSFHSCCFFVVFLEVPFFLLHQPITPRRWASPRPRRVYQLYLIFQFEDPKDERIGAMFLGCTAPYSLEI